MTDPVDPGEDSKRRRALLMDCMCVDVECCPSEVEFLLDPPTSRGSETAIETPATPLAERQDQRRED